VTALPEEIRAAAARGWRLLSVQAHGKAPLVKEWQKVATSAFVYLNWPLLMV
jgi:hypothetical protein